MSQPTLLSAIARWIVSADFPDLPDGEIAAARAALADFVAVAAAGSGTPVVRNAALYAAQNERAGTCVQQLGRTVIQRLELHRPLCLLPLLKDSADVNF